MAWPKVLSEVICLGFTEKILPVLKNAIDKGDIHWIPNKGIYSYTVCDAYFEFADCEWKLIEVHELVVSIELISGVLGEQLTLEVLRY
jgi:hypothetical protein